MALYMPRGATKSPELMLGVLFKEKGPRGEWGLSHALTDAGEESISPAR
jgi:hypothetical protein